MCIIIVLPSVCLLNCVKKFLDIFVNTPQFIKMLIEVMNKTTSKIVIKNKNNLLFM